jgi:predicted phosphodiesterase
MRPLPCRHSAWSRFCNLPDMASGRPRSALATAVLVLWIAATAACRGPAADPAALPEVLEVNAIEQLPAGTLTLPNRDGSVKFAVIGDSGRGTPEQHAVGAQMASFRQQFDFRFVLMAGDNIYEGPATPADYEAKFEAPYKALLDAGVQFFAVLGNHDDPRQVDYPPFHMRGRRYYTFTPPVPVLTRLRTRVRFFALDSNNLDSSQMDWLDRELARSTADWNVALMHYPMYSAGRYGLQARRQRFSLESRFISGGIDVAFSGHEHFYQRSTVQNGILYFVTGGAGSLRPGDAQPSAEVARSFDRDYSFMLVEISDAGIAFQAIDRGGRTVDAGSLRRLEPRPRREPTTDTAAPQ